MRMESLLVYLRKCFVGLVYDDLPTPTVEEIKDMMRNAIRDMNKAGITSVGTDDFEGITR